MQEFFSTLNGTNGFAINGINDDDYSGASVSSAGDVNGDGFDDLLIGAPGPGNSNLGQSYVVFGKSGGFGASFNLSTLNGTNGFALINGIEVRYDSKSFVSNAGDVNGDGFDDLIVGSHHVDTNGIYDVGKSYVVFGKSGGFSANINLLTLNGTNGFAINGINAGDQSGYSVSSAGDVNGDGFDDLIIGAYGAAQSYVVFGKSGGFSTSINLSTLNGTNGFTIEGAGTSVSSAGDVNGDGVDDLIIGDGVQSYVIFGQRATTLPRITLAVSPSSVTEDGTGTLIYTFTRTGSLTSPLTVNFTRGGTAIDGGDYADSGNNGNTVTFAANSATARFTISPRDDTTFEPNETVILTLASGTGYTLGTTTPVTGTILNDDTAPRITLAVSPTSVTENGTANLIYTFTRTGSLTNPLTVNYGITGTATKGTDYANIGTSVTFAANSATARVTVNPTGDTVVEPNETVILTLASGAGYTIGTTTPVTGTITNDDTAPRIT
ncbi:Calx-beta domain-containing protein, partial [Chroococcus sp. FPU101]|uniref:Calx-beta domain-containing protein n=1 Tax=Chroococcus sp. FPU101 TaxID=1974212 RepID=UPI001A8C3FCC